MTGKTNNGISYSGKSIISAMITESSTSGYLIPFWNTSSSIVTFALFLLNTSNGSIKVDTSSVAIKVFYY